jgi:hypothetical protein
MSGGTVVVEYSIGGMSPKNPYYNLRIRLHVEEATAGRLIKQLFEQHYNHIKSSAFDPKSSSASSYTVVSNL